MSGRWQADPRPEPGLLTLDQVKGRVEQLAARIAAPADMLPTYGKTLDYGHPHIERDTTYHWVVVERGEELERRTTTDLDELLYWTFETVTFDMAVKAGHYSASTQDPRRQYWTKQINLLIALHPGWAARCRARIDAVLAVTPFTDGGAGRIEES
jgi:hypothetical protein